MNAQKDILVAGGYGEVGRFASAELVRRFPGRVVIAGRDHAKARAVAATLEGARARRLDLDDAASVDAALAGVAVVLACVERHDTGLVEACLRRGIHYVDVTASHAFLRSVEALRRVAETSGAAVVLSVGLVPGVTNLLARMLTRALDRTHAVGIDVMIGLGDVHGPAAIEWTLDRMHAPYRLGERRVTPFTDPHRVELPPFGRRTTYAFDFPDQHVVARTLGIPRVQTRLCFDSAFVTWLLGLFAAIGVLRWLRWQWLRARVARLARWLSFGSATFVTRVEAHGTRDGEPARASGLVRGEGEARATGIVAALVVERILEGEPVIGVHHIDEAVDPTAALDRLQRRGFTVCVGAGVSRRCRASESA